MNSPTTKLAAWDSRTSKNYIDICNLCISEWARWGRVRWASATWHCSGTRQDLWRRREREGCLWRVLPSVRGGGGSQHGALIKPWPGLTMFYFIQTPARPVMAHDLLPHACCFCSPALVLRFHSFASVHWFLSLTLARLYHVISFPITLNFLDNLCPQCWLPCPSKIALSSIANVFAGEHCSLLGGVAPQGQGGQPRWAWHSAWWCCLCQACRGLCTLGMYKDVDGVWYRDSMWVACFVARFANSFKFLQCWHSLWGSLKQIRAHSYDLSKHCNLQYKGLGCQCT